MHTCNDTVQSRPYSPGPGPNGDESTTLRRTFCDRMRLLYKALTVGSSLPFRMTLDADFER